jgi:radical SAM superfamily enzyme YgiQ (UPF0313 family)
VKVLLISTYELGRQPFGLASPAAWLRKRGHAVACLDLSRQALSEWAVRQAELIAFYVPMHTATRLTLDLLGPVRAANSKAHLCAYGLYAPLAAESLRAGGVETLLGGEFEQALVDLAEHVSGLAAFPQMQALGPNISLARLRFVSPERADLPPLKSYAHLAMPAGGHRLVGYTEASRGCKHFCAHCPIVPVYNGVFRVVDREVVLADVRQQVRAGAQHITFGDPDFFNGIGHAMPLVEALHREFPEITYDVTIKVEHLRKNSELLVTLKNTGCLFIVSAVESLDDGILGKLQKGHTRADFINVVEACRRAGIVLQPTFVPFTPWTTFENYVDLLEQVLRLGLVEAVAPIQLAIRLLVTAKSRLLNLAEIGAQVGVFDAKTLTHPWRHRDAAIDRLCDQLQGLVEKGESEKKSRREIFGEIWRAAHRAAGRAVDEQNLGLADRSEGVPYLNEPWYC